MTEQIRLWVARQIEANAPGQGDASGVARLADAAAVLRSPDVQGQVFGFVVPPGGIAGAAELAESCLDALRAWAPLLDPGQSAHLGMVLARLGLPAVVQAPERLLAQLHDALAHGSDGIVDVACIEARRRHASGRHRGCHRRALVPSNRRLVSCTTPRTTGYDSV